MGVVAGWISDVCRVWAMEGDMLGLSAFLHGAASVVSLEAHPGYPTVGLLLPPAAPPSSCSSKASYSTPTDDLPCLVLPALLPLC